MSPGAEAPPTAPLSLRLCRGTCSPHLSSDTNVDRMPSFWHACAGFISRYNLSEDGAARFPALAISPAAQLPPRVVCMPGNPSLLYPVP